MPTKKPRLTPAVEAFYTQLLEEGKLSDAEIDTIHSLLGKSEVLDVFNRGVNATKILDDERSKIKTQQDQLEKDYNKKLGELETLQRSYAATSTTNTQKIKQLEEAMMAKETALAGVVDNYKKLHTALKDQYTGGDQVLRDLNMLDLNIPQPSTISPTQHKSEPKSEPVTKDSILDEVRKSFSRDAQVLARLPFDLLRYQSEYKQLTGKELNPSEFYDKVSKDGTGDYESVYLKEYDIQNLREQHKTSLLRAEIEQEYKDKLEQELSKRLTPQNTLIPKESDFYKSLESRIPEAERQSLASEGNGVSNRSALIADAVADLTRSQRQSS